MLNLYTNSLLNIKPTGGGETARKEVKKMEYDIIWSEEEENETITETPATLEELSEIYEIFGL